MSGKVAIVTGATQGLGAAIARELAARHAAGIVITGRNPERGEAVAARITAESGTRTVFVRAELQDVAACRRVVAETDRVFGRVDSIGLGRLRLQPVARRAAIGVVGPVETPRAPPSDAARVEARDAVTAEQADNAVDLRLQDVDRPGRAGPAAGA
jgi:short chain dehydrogenase